MVRGGQPGLEEAPEAFHGERFRRTAVKHPKDADENQSCSQANRRHEDDQRTGACCNRACVDAGDGSGDLVPVVSTRTVSAVHGVAVNLHFNVKVVCGGSGPLEGPRANGVGFLGVGEACVQDLAVRLRNSADLAVRDKNSVAAGATVPVHFVEFHHVVLNCDGEGVGFAGVVRFRKPVQQNGRVG